MVSDRYTDNPDMLRRDFSELDVSVYHSKRSRLEEAMLQYGGRSQVLNSLLRFAIDQTDESVNVFVTIQPKVTTWVETLAVFLSCNSQFSVENARLAEEAAILTCRLFKSGGYTDFSTLFIQSGEALLNSQIHQQETRFALVETFSLRMPLILFNDILAIDESEFQINSVLILLKSIVGRIPILGDIINAACDIDAVIKQRKAQVETVDRYMAALEDYCNALSVWRSMMKCADDYIAGDIDFMTRYNEMLTTSKSLWLK